MKTKIFAVLTLCLAARLASAQCGFLSWPNIFVPLPPPGGDSAAMAYDSVRNVTVLFAGTTRADRPDTNTVYDGTWEFNGSVWNLRTTFGPAPRYWHGMTYDSARQVTVLFGGRDKTQGFNDVWEWNGASWTQVTISGPSPSARMNFGMVYDSQRGVHVIFGGLNSGLLGDTWEYNGATHTWSQRATTGPAARWSTRMTYDSQRHETVLFGGASAVPATLSGQYLGDTWVWNGATWTQRAPATPVRGRHGHTFAYDSDRRVSVMMCGAIFFNSTNPEATVGEAWEWDGNDWKDVGAYNGGPTGYFFFAPRLWASMAFERGRHQMLMYGGKGYDPTGTWPLNTGLVNPSIFVNNTYAGIEDGTAAKPFNTVAEALGCPSENPTVSVRAGIYTEGAKYVFKPLILRATGGTMLLH